MYRQTLKIPWPEFGDSTRMALFAFSDDVEAALQKEAQRSAKQCRADIQNAAPKRTGAYAKTWTVKKDAADRRRPAFVVYTKRPGYQLAHLLERSHKISNQYGDDWGHTRPKPHIEPAAERNGVTFANNVRRAIQNLT